MPFVFLTQFLHIDIYGEKKEKNDAQQKQVAHLFHFLMSTTSLEESSCEPNLKWLALIDEPQEVILSFLS